MSNFVHPRKFIPTFPVRLQRVVAMMMCIFTCYNQRRSRCWILWTFICCKHQHFLLLLLRERVNFDFTTCHWFVNTFQISFFPMVHMFTYYRSRYFLIDSVSRIWWRYPWKFNHFCLGSWPIILLKKKKINHKLYIILKAEAFLCVLDPE